MASAEDPKEKFGELYEAYSKDKLTEIGKQHLDGNLKIRARKHTRLFWMMFGFAVLVFIWLGIIAVAYLLEKSNDAANKFEKNRDVQMKKYGVGSDE
jgi:hypothetical protein